MQSDLHYYGIAFLARAAGFSLEEAEIIAYSSQYVDDSTEGDPIFVGDYLFNPVRTAHYSLKAFTWGVQNKIYIPFHFLPPYPHRCNLVTKPYSNSPMAKLIFNRACEETDKKLRLVRLGVAVHTIADTFSHQGFSGRNSDENRLESYVIDDGEVVKGSGVLHYITELPCQLWQRLKSFIMPVVPTIGHAQAFHTPDIPYFKWSYRYFGNNSYIKHDNTEIFTKGFQQIYNLLCKAVQPKKRKNAKYDPKPVKPVKTWDEIEDVIKKCLTYRASDTYNENYYELNNEELRSKNWQKEFNTCYNENIKTYDKYLWRMEALQPSNPEYIKWDSFAREEISKYRFNHNPKFFSSYWVRFHRAAMTQRYLVLYHLS